MQGVCHSEVEADWTVTVIVGDGESGELLRVLQQDVSRAVIGAREEVGGLAVRRHVGHLAVAEEDFPQGVVSQDLEAGALAHESVVPEGVLAGRLAPRAEAGVLKFKILVQK